MLVKGEAFEPPKKNPNPSATFLEAAKNFQSRSLKEADLRKSMALLRTSQSLTDEVMRRVSQKGITSGNRVVEEIITTAKQVEEEYRKSWEAFSKVISEKQFAGKAVNMDDNRVKVLVSKLALNAVKYGKQIQIQGSNSTGAELYMAVLVGITDMLASNSEIDIVENAPQYIKTDQIDRFITEAEYESDLVKSLMELEKKINARVSRINNEFEKNIVRTALNRIIWGEPLKNGVMSDKGKWVIQQVVTPVAHGMLEKLWKIYGIDPNSLSKENVRIQEKFFSRFVIKEVRNILNARTNKMLNYIAKISGDQKHGRQEVNKIIKDGGLLQSWLKQNIYENFTELYPVISDSHEVTEVLKEVAGLVNPKSNGDSNPSP